MAYIDQLALKGERYIIAIDEFPYLAASYPVISSLLQKHIDHCWEKQQLVFDLMWIFYEFYGRTGSWL